MKLDWKQHKLYFIIIALIFRFISIFYCPITDADETFNYWEPLHLVLFGSGFQTWEFSPLFGLRSFSFPMLVGFPGYLISTLVFPLFQSIVPFKLLIFYTIRFLFGVFYTLGTQFFINSLNSFEIPHLQSVTWLLLTFSPGAYHASIANLPNSFAMSCLLFTYGAWLRFTPAAQSTKPHPSLTNSINIAIFSLCVAAFIGTPFILILALPIAIEALYYSVMNQYLSKAIVFSIFALFCTIGIPFCLDSSLFNTPVLAVWNIIKYNMIDHSDTSGSSLYGTEPWYWYFLNLLLNWNIVLPASFFAPITLFLTKKQIVRYFLPCLIWLGLMISLPHKEERFLFVIYPWFAFFAAYTITYIVSLLSIKSKRLQSKEKSSYRFYKILSTIILSSFVLLFTILSFSRIYWQTVAFNAPLYVYSQFNESNQNKNIQNSNEIVCIGKEWYRFPSSFFISNHFSVFWIKSEFDGLLPAPFPSPSLKPTPKIGPTKSNTWHISQLGEVARSKENLFNGDNVFEPQNRIVPLSKCDYIVDLDYPHTSEPRYKLLTKTWKILYSTQFLDSYSTPILGKSFWIPFISQNNSNWIDYVILKRK